MQLNLSNKQTQAYIATVYISHIPYSRKLSRVKTFANFAVSRPSAKVLSANFCVGGLVAVCNRQSAKVLLVKSLL